MITLESIFSKRNTASAFETISIKHNGNETDKKNYDELKNYWTLNKDNIIAKIRNNEFVPDIVTKYEIINSHGKKRKVTRHSDIDYLITKLISQKLNDFFQPLFLDGSHAYQKDKGTLTAVERARNLVNEGNQYVVEVDIQSFFDCISHPIMMETLKEYIQDAAVLNLINAYLKMTVSDSGDIKKMETGLIQGSPISPVLSNIYLMKFDRWLDENGYKWVRYSDDIFIFVTDQNTGINILQELMSKLKKDFELDVNLSKSGVFIVSGFRMLGYEFCGKNCDITIKRHSYQKQTYFRNWHPATIGKINREYHILQEGILNKKDYALLFENEDKRHHIPVEATEQIDLYNEVLISSSVFSTLSKESVRLALYDKFGDLLGYFVPEDFHQDAKTVLAQCQGYSSAATRLQTAKKMEIAAIHNIRANIRYYQKQKKCFDELIAYLSDGITQMNLAKTIEELLLIEARCRQQYYQAFNLILENEYFKFEKRTKRPPKDRINALISFGNTLLYNRIQQIIWKTSLDSRIGIFHAANKRNHSLNLDFADVFKPIIVDRVIFSLINKHQINEKMFCEYENEGAIYLNMEGKRIFIRQFEEKMNSKLEYKGKQHSYHSLITSEIQSYKDYVTEGKRYKPFKYY